MKSSIYNALQICANNLKSLQIFAKCHSNLIESLSSFTKNKQ